MGTRVQTKAESQREVVDTRSALSSCLVGGDATQVFCAVRKKPEKTPPKTEWKVEKEDWSSFWKHDNL